MNKTFYLLIFCVLLPAQARFGQTQPKNAAPVSQSDSVKKQTDYPTLKSQAEELGKATISGDFARLADYTHPKIVEQLGGKDKMIAFLKKDWAQMKAEGYELLSMNVGEVKQIEKIDAELFAVLSITLIMKIQNGKMQAESSVVGISGDGGANWKFINGVSQERFKTMFPKAGKIRIPAEQEPKPIENE
jgi:hypothetical protein